MKILLLTFMANMTITLSPWVVAQEVLTGETRTSGVLVSKIGPGELLPVSVKLLNFGGGKRVDVTLWYRVLNNANDQILSFSETVAVETTADFIKLIQIPHTMPSGSYTVQTEIVYAGQEVPATSQFSFTVERKFAGLFAGQLTILLASAFAIALLGVYAGQYFMRRRLVTFMERDGYLTIPREQRMYYRIIDDIVMRMRLHSGEDAMMLVQNIPGLVVDSESGRVIKIKKDPSKIIALLVLRYETMMGHNFNFDLTQNEDIAPEEAVSLQKNVEIARKYFK